MATMRPIGQEWRRTAEKAWPSRIRRRACYNRGRVRADLHLLDRRLVAMSVKLTRQILHGLTRENLSLLFCRAMVYFLIQGAIVALTYAFGGPGIGPDSFLTGFRLDPIHAVVHFGLGVAGTYVGFFRP